jgi:hypothetical protein
MMHDMAVCCARGDLMQHYTLQSERENIWEYFPCFRQLTDIWTRGEGSMFAMLEAWDRHMEGTNGFVSFFWTFFIYKTFSSELRLNLYEFLKF